MCPDEVAGRRPLFATEAGLLRRLLAAEFQGAEALVHQLASTLVEPIDQEGCLRLHPVDPTPAKVSRRIPVEATYSDADGVQVHVLVHVVNGVLDELEVYRDDLF
jgi:hypothetical protein